MDGVERNPPPVLCLDRRNELEMTTATVTVGGLTKVREGGDAGSNFTRALSFVQTVTLVLGQQLS